MVWRHGWKNHIRIQIDHLTAISSIAHHFTENSGPHNAPQIPIQRGLPLVIYFHALKGNLCQYFSFFLSSKLSLLQQLEPSSSRRFPICTTRSRKADLFRLDSGSGGNISKFTKWYVTILTEFSAVPAWNPREQEIEQLDAAAKRLVNDFEGALLAYIAGDRDRLIKKLEELRDSAVL